MQRFLFILSLFVGCLLLACQRQPRPIELERDKFAIRKVVALETDSYYRQDYKAWRDTYVDAPYFREYGYWEGYPEKVKIYNGFAALDSVKKKQFAENRTLWQNATVRRSNENFRIYGHVAWYTCDEVSYDRKTGNVLGRSVDTRILEKHNGKWKIAYLGFHYVPLEKTHAQRSL